MKKIFNIKHKNYIYIYIYKINKIYKFYKNSFKLLIRNKFSKENIETINFWTKNKKDLWIYKYLKKIDYKNKVTLFSVFGEKIKFLKFYKRKKIFFTGENVHINTINKEYHKNFGNHMLDKVDLSLGFEYIDDKKYVRFPLWYTYLVSTDDIYNYEKIENLINSINNVEFRKNKNRNKFATLIASHDISGIRMKIYNILQNIGEIECSGKFLKNSNELQMKYNDNKIEYMKNFKFNICPENSNTKGYITEKIFQSILSGCIPIYWGGESKEYVEPDILNEDAFIYYEEGKEKEFIDKIELLLNNDDEYEKFISIPPFKKNAPEIIWNKLREVERRIKEI